MGPLAKDPEQILTYTNISFNPAEPKDDDIAIEDIAHALSMMTRANGHFKTFYSVAQHCINCFEEAYSRGLTRRIQLACLLHDASEAYLADITRPVKQKLPLYQHYEKNIQDVIYGKFGLDTLNEAELKHIKDIDDALLHHEFLALHGSVIYQTEPVMHAQPDFSEAHHSTVKKSFLSIFSALSDHLHE